MLTPGSHILDTPRFGSIPKLSRLRPPPTKKMASMATANFHRGPPPRPPVPSTSHNPRPRLPFPHRPRFSYRGQSPLKTSFGASSSSAPAGSSPSSSAASPPPGLYSAQKFELTAPNVDLVLEDVRPYLMADGGNVDVVSVEDGVVSLRLQGRWRVAPLCFEIFKFC